MGARQRTSQERILVVDDEQSMREFLEIALVQAGYEVATAASGNEALSVLETEHFDLVITDLRMEGLSGLDLLREVKVRAPDTEVIVVTAYASYDSAIQAMKAGAYDYLKKPFRVDEILLVCERALERHRLAQENVALKRKLAATIRFSGIIGKSEAMRRVFQLIDRVAPSRSTVLIVGESGTGKELVARAIHERSPRASKPFMAINCGALPASLLESELFGHVRGAFTGADRDRPGLFRKTQGGTLLLDEVSELDQGLQVKLLRVLQERTVRPVGSDREEPVDVRVLAATNKDLGALVAEGRFREDLFYRLNVIQVRLPPLRERREDIPLLVDHFCRKYGPEAGKPNVRFSPAALKRLMDYDFPGNVRELENIVERAVILCEGDEVTPEEVLDLAPSERAQPVTLDRLVLEGKSLDDVLAEMETRLITEALARTGGNRTRAAKLLGVSFRSLRYRLEKLGLD